MNPPSLLHRLPTPIARSRRYVATTRCQRPMTTLFAPGFCPMSFRRVADGRFARRAFHQLVQLQVVPVPASTTSSYSRVLPCSSSNFTTVRKFASSSSSIEIRKDALTSSDGVGGYPIDFDTASTIEGKESQVSEIIYALSTQQCCVYVLIYITCAYPHRLSPSAWRKTKFYEQNPGL